MRALKTGKKLGARPLPDSLLGDGREEAVAARRAAVKDGGYDDTEELAQLLQGPSQVGRTAAACALLAKWAAMGRPTDNILMRVADELAQSIYITETDAERTTGVAFSNNMSVACLVKRAYKTEFAAFKTEWTVMESDVTRLGRAVDSHTRVLKLALRRWQVSNMCRVFNAWRNTVKKKHARAKVLCEVLLVERKRIRLQKALSAWRCTASQNSVARVWAQMDENLMVLEQNKLQLEQQSAELLERKAELMAQMVGTRENVFFQKGRSQGVEGMALDVEYRQQEWQALCEGAAGYLGRWHGAIATYAPLTTGTVDRRRSTHRKLSQRETLAVERADPVAMHEACTSLLFGWVNHVLETYEHEKKPALPPVTNITDDWKSGEVLAVLLASVSDPVKADELLRITWPVARLEAVLRELQALDIDEGNVFSVADFSPLPLPESILTILSCLWYRFGLNHEFPDSRKSSHTSSGSADALDDGGLQSPTARNDLAAHRQTLQASIKEYDAIGKHARIVDDYVLHITTRKANGVAVRSFSKNDELQLQKEMQTFMEIQPHHLPEVFDEKAVRHDPDALQAVLEPIRQHFSEVKQVYTLYSAGGDTSRKANMEFGQYWHFCTECQLFSGELSKQHMAALFADINIRNSSSSGVQGAPNSQPAESQAAEGLMTPSKFVQALVRLAVVSEFGSTIVPGAAQIVAVQEAVTLLLTTRIFPKAGMSMRMGTMKASMRSDSIQTTLRKQRQKLAKIFRTYIGTGASKEPGKHLSMAMQCLSFSGVVRLLDDVGLLEKKVTAAEVRELYDSAQAGTTDDDSETLVFSEFEEWVVAMAAYLNPSPFEDLAAKVNQFVDVLSKANTQKKKGK